MQHILWSDSRILFNYLRNVLFWLPAVCIALLFTALRLPILSDPGWQPDEGIQAYMGMQIAQGYRLYTDFWDHKPPMLWWVFAGNFVLFKQNLLPLRLGFALASTSTILLCSWIVYRYRGRTAALATAFILCILLAPLPLTNGATSAEELLSPCLLLAIMLMFVHRGNIYRHICLPGFLLGVAFCLKPSALIYAYGFRCDRPNGRMELR